jgi:hypothetical protein
VQYPQFLNPGQVSTGLTPQMISQINSPPPTMLAQQQAAGGPPRPQGGGNMREMIARPIAQNERSRAEALRGGTFSGTNEQRQQHLRANRGYRSAGSGDHGGGSYGGNMR